MCHSEPYIIRNGGRKEVVLCKPEHLQQFFQKGGKGNSLPRPAHIILVSYQLKVLLSYRALQSAGRKYGLLFPSVRFYILEKLYLTHPT